MENFDTQMQIIVLEVDLEFHQEAAVLSK